MNLIYIFSLNFDFLIRFRSVSSIVIASAPDNFTPANPRVTSVHMLHTQFYDLFLINWVGILADWVCVLCVLSCVVSGGGPTLCSPHIQGGPPLCIMSSVLVHLCCSPAGIWPMCLWLRCPGGCKSYIGRG